MININNILVPTDCSEVSKCALKYAIKFAKQFDANLTLLMVSVSEPLTILNDYGYFSPELHQKLVTESDKRAKSELETFWNQSKDDDIEAKLINIKGDPFTEIVRYASETSVDIIIMGTHGRTGLKHVLMGSVAEKVVRYSPQPVLTIKDKDYIFDMEKTES
ncbi:universal stress protein [bacterium]|nr:universal stress protein [bacterium]